MSKKLLLCLCCLWGGLGYGQVVISLLFGDKLNSDKIEFGLDGGVSFSDLNGLDPSDTRKDFNIGFYFDFLLKEKFKLHTGVLVKSNMGGKGIPPYPIGDPELDPIYTDGEVGRKLSYFNVPIYAKYTFWKSVYMEAGPQIGLLHKAEDTFKGTTDADNTVLMRQKVKDWYTTFDFGLTAGLGYKLLKGTGINMGIRYYWGLVDVNKQDGVGAQYNRTLYLYAGIPIGTQKKEAP